MLGKKDKDNQFAAGGHTLLARAVEITGDIKFGGDMEIIGIVRGNIYAEPGADAELTISEKGEVFGEIHAPKIIVRGSVNGDIHSSKHLELAAKAMVNGNVHYSAIEVVKGAQVNGKLEHVESSSSVVNKPIPKPEPKSESLKAVPAAAESRK